MENAANQSCTARRSCLPGHIFSSTSQQISALSMQSGKYFLECRSHSLQDTAVMSSQAASMAAPRVIWVCGHTSSIGFRNGELGGRFSTSILSCAASTVQPQKSGGRFTIPNYHMSLVRLSLCLILFFLRDCVLVMSVQKSP